MIHDPIERFRRLKDQNELEFIFDPRFRLGAKNSFDYFGPRDKMSQFRSYMYIYTYFMFNNNNNN